MNRSRIQHFGWIFRRTTGDWLNWADTVIADPRGEYERFVSVLGATGGVPHEAVGPVRVHGSGQINPFANDEEHSAASR